MEPTHGRTGESLLQLEIQKVQQTFAMSANDEPEEFEDIKFFTGPPPKPHPKSLSKGGLGGGGGDVIRGTYLNNTGPNDMDCNNEASVRIYEISTYLKH